MHQQKTSRPKAKTGHSASKSKSLTTPVPTSSIRKRSSIKHRKALSSSVRSLHIHEFQAKDLLLKNGIPTTDHAVVSSASEAGGVAHNMFISGIKAVVVKSQVHAGGRGKGHFLENSFQGGVHKATTAKEVEKIANEMLGNHLVTAQTGTRGQLVSHVLLEPACDIQHEKYLAIILDRKTHKGPTIIASPKGGMDIEDVAHSDPKAILTVPIDILNGITDKQALEVVDFLGDSTPGSRDSNAEMVKKLYQLFVATDSTQIEINPIGVGADGQFICLDSKFGFDDNASFRQKDLWLLRDETMENPRDVEAESYGLNYVELEGNIALMVNGAGLAMATLDCVKYHGGSAANFLDIGGGASKQAIEQAFRLVLTDRQVKAVLVNIFGGILRADLLAEGIIEAAKQLEIKIPVVVRLEGNNSLLGKKMLSESGLKFITADSLDNAVQLAIESAKKQSEKH